MLFQPELPAEFPVSFVARAHNEQRHGLGQKVCAGKGVDELVLGGAWGNDFVQASLHAHLEFQVRGRRKAQLDFQHSPGLALLGVEVEAGLGLTSHTLVNVSNRAAAPNIPDWKVCTALGVLPE